MLAWIFTAMAVHFCEVEGRNDMRAVFSFAESGPALLNVKMRLRVYFF